MKPTLSLNKDLLSLSFLKTGRQLPGRTLPPRLSLAKEPHEISALHSSGRRTSKKTQRLHFKDPTLKRSALLSSLYGETAPKPRWTGVEPGARSPVPGSDSLALRGVACQPGNRSVRRRLGNHHSFHVPPVPPPLRQRTLGPPLNSASGQGDRLQPGGSPRSVGGRGGREGTHPRPQPQLHPQQTYRKVGS